MKKFLNIPILATIVLVTSCSDYLNEKLNGTYSTDSFYQTSDQALLALTGVYNGISFTSTNNAVWVFGDVASDDAIKGGAVSNLPDIAAIDNFGYLRTNSYIENQWKVYYDAITRANFLLYYLPAIDMDATLKARIQGEAKFLRAYCYFNLVNIYGEVPLRLQPPISQATTYVAKSPVADVYAQIIQDLTDAAPALEASYGGSDVGRATKGSAYGLLAKAQLYQGKWQACLDAIDQLNASFAYSLVPYQNNFLDSTQNNSESVFEIEHLQGQSPSEGSYMDQFFSPQKNGGYYVDDPLQNFVDEFEKTADGTYDPRLDYTVGRAHRLWVNGELFDPSWSPTGYLQRKNVQPIKQAPIVGNAGLNYVYMRYADVLLFKAEALNELGRGSEALVPLNQVRDRARNAYSTDSIPEPTMLPPVTTTLQTDLRAAIRHERRVELGFEFHRYFDLMRYTATPDGLVYTNAALAGTAFTVDKNRYFLIPQSELDTNPAITP